MMKLAFVLSSIIVVGVSATPALRSLRRSNEPATIDVVGVEENATAAVFNENSDILTPHAERQLAGAWQYYNYKGDPVSESDLLCYNNPDMKYGYSSCHTGKNYAIGAIDVFCYAHGGRLYKKGKAGCRWAYQCCRYIDDRNCA